ncbi:MAG: TlpA family protein disulfide reductase [Bacteroidetes bacterium]|nr:TlpA family protein disulfide reductase [Bacteroidota bacterium]
MKKTSIICSFFLLLNCLLLAQNVLIKGIATGAEGKTLSLYKLSDPYTQTQLKLASGEIDSAGKFSFSFKTDLTFLGYLKIGFSQAPFYVEPGKTYDLSISCSDCNSSDDKTNPYLNPKQLSIFIINSDSTELNNIVNRFDDLYDDFILKHYESLLKHRKKPVLDTFRLIVDKHFSFVNNEYFKNFVKYRFATIEFIAKLAGNEIIAKKYILKQPVLYNNTAYLEFFDEFFNNYVTSVSNKITKNDLYNAVNLEKSFLTLMDSLGKDSILRNEVVRELVALKCLGEIYYDKDYNKQSILDMLKYVAENSKFTQHRQIAENYIKLLTKLTIGTKAPDFSLKDFQGTSYSLSELNKDKYVYLIFWTTWCVPCIAEMELIGKLKTKYGTKVEFVGISTDKEFLTYYYFMKKNKTFDFITLHWGNNTEFLDNYNVKTYPNFVLIGTDGKIVQYPADTPSTYLDALLFNLTKIKN